MGYSSEGPKPFERASRAQHHHIINDAAVQALIGRCWLPAPSEKAAFESILVQQQPVDSDPVEYVIAVDGGYAETPVRTEFPSASIAFLQFGALLFREEELRRLDRQAFIDPTDMAKLKNLQRLKLALPLKNVRVKDQSTLTASVRRGIFDFFAQQKIEDRALIDTLAWIVFRRFKAVRTPEDQTWHLAQNPYTGDAIDLAESALQADYTFKCPTTKKPIYLTDVFRLHEVIDEERGAAGILGYLTNTIEHLIIAHLVHQLLLQQPNLLNQVFFIKDGPLGFFGQTANLHKPFRELANMLFGRHNFLLAGLEKSGAFVEHAREIAPRLPNGSVLLLSNDYIYKYILPGAADPNRAYGSTTNYGHKVIFKSKSGQMHVVSLPACTISAAPQVSDIPNFHLLLKNIEALRCDMYDSALIPVALVNSLVSLSDHPSAQILRQFAAATVQR
jgi:hypothetical protein